MTIVYVSFEMLVCVGLTALDFPCGLFDFDSPFVVPLFDDCEFDERLAGSILGWVCFKAFGWVA